MEDVLDLDPSRRRPVDRGQEDPAVRVADGEGEPGVERLQGKLAVIPLPDEPLVTDGELRLQHGDPLERLRGSASMRVMIACRSSRENALVWASAVAA